MIKAILFDLGDTVIANDWKARNGAVKEETGLDLVWTPEIKELNNEVIKGKKLMKDLFEKIIENEGLKVSAKSVVESYTKNYEKYCPVNEKMIVLVDKLRKKVKMYALSNTNDIHKKVNVKRGVYDHFDKAFLSVDMGMKKPSADIFKFVLDEIEIKAKEVLFIDDNEDNVKMAADLGIKTIRYEKYEDLVQSLKKFNL